MNIQDEIKVVDRAIEAHQSRFGRIFGLKAFTDPGRSTFRINKILSRYDEKRGTVLLYLDVFEDDSHWERFIEATPEELEKESVKHTPAQPSTTIPNEPILPKEPIVGNPWEEDNRKVAEAVAAHKARYGEVFGLRAFPGRKFSVNPSNSFYSQGFGIQLYTDVLTAEGKWAAFAKGSPAELNGQTVILPPTPEEDSSEAEETGQPAGVSEAPEAERAVAAVGSSSEVTEDHGGSSVSAPEAETGETPMSEQTTNNQSPVLPSAKEVESAKQAMANAQKNTPAKPAAKATKKTSKKTAPAQPETVTLSAADLKSIVDSAVQAAVGAVATKPAKKASKKTAKKTAASKRASNRAKARADRREQNRNRAAEALDAAVKSSGKSEEEVKAAFRAAHEFAREDQADYKARYNAKLSELIGVTRYAA
jgi:hypothetical protein